MNFLTDHLASVEETYFQHMCHALRFAGTLMVAALACLLHAIFPFLFVKTGSALISGLHRDMVTDRHRLTPSPAKGVSTL